MPGKLREKTHRCEDNIKTDLKEILLSHMPGKLHKKTHRCENNIKTDLKEIL
jgi:hypothetical protein